jgi:hypothetical protein
VDPLDLPNRIELQSNNGDSCALSKVVHVPLSKVVHSLARRYRVFPP